MFGSGFRISGLGPHLHPNVASASGSFSHSRPEQARLAPSRPLWVVCEFGGACRLGFRIWRWDSGFQGTGLECFGIKVQGLALKLTLLDPKPKSAG